MARVCVDSRYFNVDGSGLLTFIPSSVGIQQLLVFDTVGVTNFNKATYPGLLRVHVRVVGGGGGAAGGLASPSQTVARASASGGSYSESLLNAAALGALEVITVGAGGAGGAGNIAGTAGGTSSFGGFVTAPGGNGSALSMTSGLTEATAPGTGPGALGVGQIRTTGEPGGQAHRSADASAQTQPGGGAGGGYGAGGTGNLGGDGFPGTGYGGGGSGAVSFGFSQTGGAGSRGAVFVTLYF